MLLKNRYYFKEWRFYFKLGFGLFFLIVLLYAWLNPIINGITVPEKEKPPYSPHAVNWQWYTIDKGDFTLNFLSFFTIQTNIMVSAWLIGAALCHKQEGKITSKWFGQYMTLAITTFITITGLLFNTLLLPNIHLQGFYQWFTNVIQHMVCPLVMIIYFIFFMRREQNAILSFTPFAKKYLWKYYLYPLVWLVVMLIRGEFRYQAGKAWAYQYFFINIHAKNNGLPGPVWLLIATILVATIVFVIPTLFNYLNYKMLTKNNGHK